MLKGGRKEEKRGEHLVQRSRGGRKDKVLKFNKAAHATFKMDKCDDIHNRKLHV